MKRPRQRIDVNLGELDRVVDGARRAPLSEADCDKLKGAPHALAAMLARPRTTEKTSAVLGGSDGPNTAGGTPPRTGFWSASGDVVPWREACKRGTDMIRHSLLFLVAGLGMISTVAQGPRDPAALIAAQREAMVRLAYMDGIWRGPAWTILDSGQKHTITQTERIGPFLSGSVKVIEGRGYDADGTVSFNAFGTISYDSFKHDYILHSYAQGYVGDFVLKLSSDGYVWEIPAGPMTIRYTAVIKDGHWHEVGDRIAPGKEPVRIFDMSLTRVGDTNWPAAGAVSPTTK